MIDPSSHPSSSMVKTFGVINIVLATLGLTIGMFCMDLFGLFASSLSRSVSRSTTVVTKGARKNIDRRIEALEEQEAAAKIEQEKTALRRQRQRLKSQLKNMDSYVQAGEIDIRLDSPLYVGHYVFQLTTGIILNVLLLISGIGLLRYADWARKLSIGAAIARIVEAVAAAVSYIGFVLPYVIRQTIAAAANPKTPMMASAAAMTETNRGVYTIGALLFMVLMMTYPIVSIVLLNLKGPRVLCRASKSKRDRIDTNQYFE